MTLLNSLIRRALVAALVASPLVMTLPAVASDAGAFLGGVLATKIVGNMERRTEAEEVQAYNSSQPQPVAQQQAAPAQQQGNSAEARLQELDKLAAGGYITPEEYKAKKQSILDSM